MYKMTLDDWMSLKKEIKEEFIKASALRPDRIPAPESRGQRRLQE